MSQKKKPKFIIRTRQPLKLKGKKSTPTEVAKRFKYSWHVPYAKPALWNKERVEKHPELFGRLIGRDIREEREGEKEYSFSVDWRKKDFNKYVGEFLDKNKVTNKKIRSKVRECFWVEADIHF